MSDTILPGAITASFGFFTRHEAVTVEAAMSRIFPDDDLGPGSVAAGAVYYLDRVLMGAEQHRQQFYRAAIKSLDAVARSRFGNFFEKCGSAEQDELIGAMATNALPEFGATPTAPAFFEILRAHTVEGVFCDPIHGGNRDFAGWRLLGYPGPQPSYSHAEQQLDAVIVRDRIFSASDYPLSSGDNVE